MIQTTIKDILGAMVKAGYLTMYAVATINSGVYASHIEKLEAIEKLGFEITIIVYGPSYVTEDSSIEIKRIEGEKEQEINSSINSIW